jgi:superfamily II DNA helicase RecQ
VNSSLNVTPTTSLNVTNTTMGELCSVSGDPVKDILQQIFGHQSFRKGQEEATRTIMKGLDTLLVMPTGGDKTLCYAIPAVISKGITIVVTPLLALMDDQVKRLKQKMSVCYINSMMPEDEKDTVLHCLSQKDIPYDILFITPEALLAPQLQAIVKRMSEAGTLSRIVMDEAHCVDTWGTHGVIQTFLFLKNIMFN